MSVKQNALIILFSFLLLVKVLGATWEASSTKDVISWIKTA